MNSLFRNIALRVAVLIALLIGMNALYSRFFYEDDLQRFAPVINSIRDLPKGARIVYIGESSNVTTAHDDLDQRSIGEMLNEYFPKVKVGQITQAAAHAGIFKSYLEQIDPSSDIETVVVTLNLRSFNAEWIHSGLETPLRKGTLILADRPALWNRFLLAFKAYPVSTEKERYATVNQVWKKELLGLGKTFPYATTYDWKTALEEKADALKSNPKAAAEVQLAHEYVCAYAFRIDTLTNPRVADLNEIIALAKERKWRLVFNLMAENVETARAVGGEELISIMNDNRTLLKDYFGKKGIHVVDHLDRIPDAEFVDKEWPTEHYNQRGRRKIAESLAKELQRYYPGEFAIPNHVHFYNDCEGTLPWANQRTLSRESAASGQFSSKTDAHWEYSLNFRAPMADIPKKARKTVKVSMMVNGEIYNRETLLVLDVHLKSGERYWKPIALNELTTPKKGWQKIQHTYDLSSVGEEGELIEIYVYNRSGKVLYVDDIDIRFHE